MIPVGAFWKSGWIMLACLLALLSARIYSPVTLAGRQCPTASVQLVLAPVRNCCGKIIGYAKRAPRPGESGFVQCRCAERKSASLKATSDRGETVVILKPAEQVQPQPLLVESWTPPYSVRLAGRQPNGIVHPPCLA